MSRPIYRAAITACVVVWSAAAQAGGVIDLGLSDEFTLSQPVVQVQVGRFGSLPRSAAASWIPWTQKKRAFGPLPCVRW